MIGAFFAFYHHDGIFLQLTTLKNSLPKFFVVVWLLNRKWCCTGMEEDYSQFFLTGLPFNVNVIVISEQEIYLICERQKTV